MRAHVAILLSLFVASYSHAAKTEEAADFPSAPISTFQSPYDAKASSDLVAYWLKAERKPADTTVLKKTDMTPSMTKIRDGILSATTADELDAKLDELQTGYEKMTPDAKFFAIQMLALKPLRGVVWNLRPLFEKGEDRLFGKLRGNFATHSAAVTILRMVAQTTGLYLPTKQSAAMFDYLTTPRKTMHLADRFDTVAKFQSFLRGPVYAALDKAANEIEPMHLTKGKSYVFDYQMVMGKEAFADGIGQYGAYGDAEVLLTSAAIYRGMHNILVFNAYNQDELMNVMGDLARMYGINGVWSDELGVSTREKVEVLSSYQSKGFLVLRKSRSNEKLGQGYMDEAFKNLELSVKRTKDAYDILAVLPGGVNTVLNPLFFKSDLQPELGQGVAKLDAAMKGRVPVRNVVTGKTLDIDIPNFYHNAPPNLLKLLPLPIPRGQQLEFSMKNDIGETLTYRNYREGQPKSYVASEWKRLFPTVSNNTNMSEVFRNLAYSRGPALILGPLSYFID